MMKLFYQTHSPFARKALVFAHEAGLADQLEVIHQETSPTVPNEDVFKANPLGKVPILVTNDAEQLFDSDVICAFLDTLHSGPKLIPNGTERWRALRLQALAQGLCDVGIALRWECVRRPEPLRYPPLQQGYALKLLRSYDWLERELDIEAPVHVGHIAVATALSWLEFRNLPAFRPGRIRLSAWLDRFGKRASMQRTTFTGETQDQP